MDKVTWLIKVAIAAARGATRRALCDPAARLGT